MPAGLDAAKPLPLVFALHGGGGNAPRMEQVTAGSFNHLAGQEGFLVVYPEGIEKHWNDGREGLDYRAHREKVDDIGFISALSDALAAELPVDRQRVYVTGLSNGGMMTHRLACALSGQIAAAAPVIAALPESLRSAKPSRPVPILMITSPTDPLVPWAGGDVHFGRSKLGRALSAEETVKFWVKHNRARESPEKSLLPDTDPADGTRVRREAYAAGQDGAEVILHAVEGGGHPWPGGWKYAAEKFVGKTSRALDATRTIWEFFKRHPGK